MESTHIPTEEFPVWIIRRGPCGGYPTKCETAEAVEACVAGLADEDWDRTDNEREAQTLAECF